MKENPSSLEDLYESYKRVYPWHRGPSRVKRFLGWIDADELRVSFFVFIVLFTIVAFLDILVGVDPADVLVEAHGLLMDVLLFGCLILWFNLRRDERVRKRQYQEILEDFSYWIAEEGVLRKVGSIKRLLDMGGPKFLPSLDYQQLPKANFQGMDLEGVDFSFSNLNSAFLNGTYFANADLSKADLAYACLAWAVCEHADLRGADLRGADLEGIKLDGAKLGKITVGQASSIGPRTYVTDLRGVMGLTPEVLMSSNGWEDCYRDLELACGKAIPMPTDLKE